MNAPTTRIAEAAPAYLPTHAANADAVAFDLFSALRMLQRVYAMPSYKLDTLLDRIEAIPGTFDAIPIGTLLRLVGEASAEAAQELQP